jgi:hypothetical protein
MDAKIDAIVKYVFYIVLSVCGWLLVNRFTAIETKLEAITEDVLQLRIQIAKMEASQLSEPRVLELIDVALVKHGVIK